MLEDPNFGEGRWEEEPHIGLELVSVISRVGEELQENLGGDVVAEEFFELEPYDELPQGFSEEELWDY